MRNRSASIRVQGGATQVFALGGCHVHRIFSDIDERHRYFLLVLTDFAIAVCSAKLIVHLIILV
jgi:hypothetical protein